MFSKLATMDKIVVIDDDQGICMLLQKYLSKNGFDVQIAFSGKSGLDLIRKNIPKVVLADFRLKDMDGDELLSEVKSVFPDLPVIIMTGYSNVQTAVKIMKYGAYDYVTKPLIPEEILINLKKAAGKKEEEKEISAQDPNSKEEIQDRNNHYVFGNSKVFREILDQIRLVAPTNYSVVIYGESGSGKESVAHEIHHQSLRRDQPFVAIDCGALSKELAMSELFGHEKGSFTGAIQKKTGSFELADGGTIFLDEIANLSYDIQVALLRVIQERKIRRLGGIRDIDVDVRIIVASNERLINIAKEGKFREDLYHRFNEFSIEIPPLRMRQQDLIMYANHFLNLTNKELNKNIEGFSDEVVELFKNYPWPGNLRELNNVIKRSTLLSQSSVIEKDVLPSEITYSIVKTSDQLIVPEKKIPLDLKNVDMKQVSNDAEFELIVKALKECNYNKSKAAQLLNIDRKTLYNKMRLYKEFNGNF